MHEELIRNIEQDKFTGDVYFPTMIFAISCFDHERLNTYLLELIYSERNADKTGLEKSNYRRLGGWHSHSKLHEQAVYAPLTSRINQAGQRISDLLGYDIEKRLAIGTMWAIINPPGSSNRAHIHPSSHWSGVYYIQAPENAGVIEFIDPRTPYVMNQPTFEPGKKRPKECWTKVNFTPEAGKMLIFPSWLYHGVDPNLSNQKGNEGDRVIISFNLSQMSRDY